MKKKVLSLEQSAVILLTVLVILFIGCVYLRINSQIVLFCCGMFLAALAKWNGYSYQEIEEMATKGISQVASALIFNLCIGMLISSWIAAGTFAYIIDLCLHLINPRFFLSQVFLFCCLFSALTGSCWICAGTVGLAFFSISQELTINSGVLLGAIVGGSRFGACISPISDSANVSRLLSGVENIYDHILATIKIVVPAALLTLIIYLAMDLWGGDQRGKLDISQLGNNMESIFHLNVLTLLPVAILCFMLLKKCNSLICMVASIFCSSTLAVILQKQTLREISDILFNGYGAYIVSDNQILAGLFSRGGMISMCNVIYTLIIGMSMGSVLKHLGVLQNIIFAITKRVHSTKAILLFTMALSVFGYGVVGDSQPVKVLIGGAFSKVYDKLGLERTTLSRTLEMSAFGEGIFPWTVGGLYLSTLFGYPVSQYCYLVFFYYFSFLFNLSSKAHTYKKYNISS